MTSEPDGEKGTAPSPDPAGADGSHLDEDPEALEDPVHSGDAKHQHDLHEQAGRD